ncbi:type I restriction enzyme HsdR N-terminal domain-containing protein [Chromohalobacter israelensis]|uniref:type I restriction enzyme HsdR N-terminal domain-containing protein n=1 Tax=Chromohalobacter israelensis TaxID=141390 RepID=UPI001C63BF0A
MPEFTADVGTKKGEKVDYAIRADGNISILMECKPLGTNLANVQYNQLYRYFSCTDAKFAILTNGFEYRFYSWIHRITAALWTARWRQEGQRRYSPCFTDQSEAEHGIPTADPDPTIPDPCPL